MAVDLTGVVRMVADLKQDSEIPKQAGLSFKACFLSDVLENQEHGPEWLEVITENFLGDRGRRLKTLRRLSESYPIALHGVGLNIASPEEIDNDYLKKLKELESDIQPVRVSDHLCWCGGAGAHFHDLYPFPYTRETLNHIGRKVERVQDVLKRPLVLENLSAYLSHNESEMTENEFLNELCRKTGCQRLVDVNNLQVQKENFGDDPFKTLDQIPREYVAEYHLAGFTRKEKFTLDTHSQGVYPEVWEIFQYAYQRKPAPFCLEWDADLPDYEKLKSELNKAKSYVELK